jgi:predicted ATPase
MLEFLRIQRFKTLFDAQFPLSNLNLFTGLNGMGKSSLIQALLLLRQSHEVNALQKKGLLLKGNYLNLGTGQDILSMQADINSIEFLLKATELPQAQHYLFNYIAKSDLQPWAEPPDFTVPEEISLFNTHFQYLAADRIGPRSHYALSDFSLQELQSLGSNGEYAIQYIAENGGKNLAIPALKHKGTQSATFLENLNAWMSDLSPGIRVRALAQPQFNAVTLAYAFLQGGEWTTDFKPQNVGFGLTYVLPVVTALLRAKPGDLLILENPESHLHPAGQFAVGRLCAMVANAGVQLILESHSDHFLNGIRVAVKNQLIPAEKVRLFYLERQNDNAVHQSTVYQPELDDDGRIDHWPKGFFDEWDKSLEQLL